MSKIRPLGNITEDMEKLLFEMVDDHDLQWGEILNLVHGHLAIHLPNAQEEYEDNSSPVFYYGAEDGED